MAVSSSALLSAGSSRSCSEGCKDCLGETDIGLFGGGFELDSKSRLRCLPWPRILSIRAFADKGLDDPIGDVLSEGDGEGPLLFMSGRNSLLVVLVVDGAIGPAIIAWRSLQN